MSTKFNRSLIESYQADARGAVERLNALVTEMLPPGTEVEYRHGMRWIGPCKVDHVASFGSDHYGPRIGVTNLRTGKSLSVCSVGYIRLIGENQGGEA
ncbi:hypothetical protein LG302_00820 [Halomonas organivorans]